MSLECWKGIQSTTSVGVGVQREWTSLGGGSRGPNTEPGARTGRERRPGLGSAPELHLEAQRLPREEASGGASHGDTAPSRRPHTGLGASLLSTWPALRSRRANPGVLHPLHPQHFVTHLLKELWWRPPPNPGTHWPLPLALPGGLPRECPPLLPTCSPRGLGSTPEPRPGVGLSPCPQPDH